MDFYNETFHLCDFSTECTDGLFGDKCAQTCSSHCAGDGLCHKVTGHCLSGCHSGYHGRKCDIGELSLIFFIPWL